MATPVSMNWLSGDTFQLTVHGTPHTCATLSGGIVEIKIEEENEWKMSLITHSEGAVCALAVDRFHAKCDQAHYHTRSPCTWHSTTSRK